MTVDTSREAERGRCLLRAVAKAGDLNPLFAA
jgi:hypothetical protein